jgi:hypothetical protein
VAEGARLESVYTLTGIVGSNPTLSATIIIFLHLYALVPRRASINGAATRPTLRARTCG